MRVGAWRMSVEGEEGVEVWRMSEEGEGDESGGMEDECGG